MRLGQYANAWGIYLGFMLVLVWSALFLVFWAPMAAGGGVPEVISFLNGSRPKGLFDLKTGFAKAAALVLAVSSGLAIGPEGPFIHLGAVIGPQILWIFQYFFRGTRIGRYLRQLESDTEVRNFVVIGAAAGIAVAFRAPIGGVVFVLEEAISFFDAKLIFRAYFVCAVSYYALQIMMEGHYLHTNSFTEFDLKSTCQVGYDAEDLLMFVVLGLLGGVCGALWNWLIIKLAAFRSRFVRHGWKRLLDALVVCLITSLFVAFLPVNYRCTDANNLVSHLPPAELANAKNFQFNSSVFTSDRYCLADTSWQYFRQYDDTSDGVVDFLESELLDTINCPHGSYNELASLVQTTGHEAVSLLFASGVYNVLRAPTIIIFMLVYMLLSVLAATLSVPAGMVVPSLTIGGCLGRLVALFYNYAIKNPLGLVPVDPGPWAMVGAAAFWCGSARITVTIAIIILEITGDFRYVPPIAVAVMFAKLSGQFFTDGVYHMIIHLKGISFLEDIPSKAMDGRFVVDIMTKPAVCVTEKSLISELRTMLLSNNHNGFPVVRASDGKIRLCGLVLRKHLVDILNRPGVTDSTLVELGEVMNETPITVLKEFTYAQAFRMFRTMGLRHLPVVDIDHVVQGILTRRNFMIHPHSYVPAASPEPSEEAGDVELAAYNPHDHLFLLDDEPPLDNMP